jgi:hypothetical protein
MYLYGRDQQISFVKNQMSQHQWITAVILSTQETETKRIAVQSQSRKIVHETLSPQKRAGGVP